MNKDFAVKDGRALRRGYTTGSCAAAAAKAAARMLLSGETLETVQLMTPKGLLLFLEIRHIERKKDVVSCAVTKDGGDDPDITHGMDVYASVSLTPQGIQIDGGEGVGRVTRKGLKIPPGRPAINPVPQKMIREALAQVCKELQYSGGLQVVISIPGGREAAARTFNPRLGIEGGLSILGTTGIVEPMSEQALLDTIYVEMNMQYASSSKEVLLTPGNYGRDFLEAYGGILPEESVKCSNFIGETLDYGVYLGFSQIYLVGHLGKLVKLAGGIMNTHSRMADCRMEILGVHAALAGAGPEAVQKILGCITTEEAVEVIADTGVLAQVQKSLEERIQFHLDQRVKNACHVDFLVYIDGNRPFLQSQGIQLKRLGADS